MPPHTVHRQLPLIPSCGGAQSSWVERITLVGHDVTVLRERLYLDAHVTTQHDFLRQVEVRRGGVAGVGEPGFDPDAIGDRFR